MTFESERIISATIDAGTQYIAQGTVAIIEQRDFSRYSEPGIRRQNARKIRDRLHGECRPTKNILIDVSRHCETSYAEFVFYVGNALETEVFGAGQ